MALWDRKKKKKIQVGKLKKPQWENTVGGEQGQDHKHFGRCAMS